MRKVIFSWLIGKPSSCSLNKATDDLTREILGWICWGYRGYETVEEAVFLRRESNSTATLYRARGSGKRNSKGRERRKKSSCPSCTSQICRSSTLHGHGHATRHEMHAHYCDSRRARTSRSRCRTSSCPGWNLSVQIGTECIAGWLPLEVDTACFPVRESKR